MTKLEVMRNAAKKAIALDPLKVEYMYRQPYRMDESRGKVKDGEPVKVKGFKNDVKVFDSMKDSGVEIKNSILLNEVTKYIMCEYDDCLEYGLVFQYYDKLYEVQTVKEKIKYGGIISLYAELKDVSEGSLYGV